jgi:hypothetical protein
MKSNLFKNVLDWSLAIGVLLSIIFFVQFYNRTKSLRELNMTFQANLSQLQNSRQVLNMLLNETDQYNRARPDANLTRILQSLRPAAANTNPAAPAAK